MSPEELLKYLKSTTNTRIHHSLDAIYEVCLEQKERGINDFSIITIARLGADRGVPKTQSIRNKTGENYRALIKAFADNCDTKTSSKNKRKSDAWIDDIKDPKLKTIVQIQSAQLAEAKKLLREIAPPDLEIRVFDSQVSISEYKLSKSERASLEYLISKEFLNEWDFQVGERGEVRDSSGKRIFKVASIDALKKALKYL